ncbi:hypothetical protein ACWEFL_24955 [Streptomyces sp. NPDC004838]
MPTPRDARTLFVAYSAEHPPPVYGELRIAPEWYEVAVDDAPVRGAREFIGEGRAAFGRMDDTAISVDKLTGKVGADWHAPDWHAPDFGEVRALTPVAVGVAV